MNELDFDESADEDKPGCTIDLKADHYKALARHLALKALVDLGGLRNAVSESHCSEHALLDFLEISSVDEDGDYAVAIARENIRQAARASTHPGWPEDSPILQNMRWLQARVDLSELETWILLLAVLCRKVDALGRALACVGSLNLSSLVNLLSVLLDASSDEVAKALSANGRLARSRLLTVDHSSHYEFRGKMDLIEGLIDRIEYAHGDPFELFAGNFTVGKAAELTLDDYDHLAPLIGDLVSYLRDALQSGRAGVNVLIYGPPGTGKTELSRAIAAALDARLFEVAITDRHGGAQQGPQRLASYALSQEVLSSTSRCIILFDEIEDFSPDASGDDDEIGGRRSKRHGNKAWLNNLLETNRTPAIWISNRVGHLDPAHRRRFDLPLFVDIPPTAVRTRFLAQHALPLGVPLGWCERISRQCRLSPAAVTRATRFVKGVREADASRPVEDLFEQTFSAYAQLSMGRRLRFDQDRDALDYSLDLVNADVDLAHLVEGLRLDSRCRIALLGPSGTGKSAFARNVARELDKPLMVERASDLLKPHVGESEEAIAEAFSRAAADGAVLLIDEVDSFLRSRADLRQNWEATMVNEMLVQLEEFSGTLFVTSNFAERLDPASLRRFDLKVEFDYMKEVQAMRLLEQACARLSLKWDPACVRGGELADLTPGIFSLVMRQARFRKVSDQRDLIDRLREEVSRNPAGKGRPMGFLVPVAA
jgi:transitional endoplasmic reticulum ATPase